MKQQLKEVISRLKCEMNCIFHSLRNIRHLNKCENVFLLGNEAHHKCVQRICKKEEMLKLSEKLT